MGPIDVLKKDNKRWKVINPHLKFQSEVQWTFLETNKEIRASLQLEIRKSGEVQNLTIRTKELKQT